MNLQNMLGIAGGFMPPAPLVHLSPSQGLFTRGADAGVAELAALNEAITRGDTVDQNALIRQTAAALAAVQRGITTATTAFPVRENLEAETALLLPEDTPFRNMLPRVPGAGNAVSWRQVVSLGGGWGSGYDQLGGATAAQVFFSETGAPAELTTIYAPKSVGYKLLGTKGSVTGFAAATGANFQNQLATERTHSVRNLMLIEEFVLINGDATSTAAPFGDGAQALAFNGVINLVTAANGVPAANVQTAVGALTFAHIDAQLKRIWQAGGRQFYILCNAVEAQSIKNIAMGSGTIHRVVLTEQGNAQASTRVQSYTHPQTGEAVPIIVDRFMPPGTMIFGCKAMNESGNPLQVNVLPQVELPELAPNESIQGFTAQEIAPTGNAPQVYGWLTSVYETLQMRNGLVFAKSSGLTAV